MRARRIATAHLAIFCCLSLAGDCSSASRSYAVYTRLPLMALRHGLYTDSSCTNLIVKLPVGSAFSDVEMKLAGSIGPSAQFAEASGAADRDLGNLSYPCYAIQGIGWQPLRLHTTSIDSKYIYRASLAQPKAVAYVNVMVSGSQLPYAEFSIGLFIESNEGSQGKAQTAPMEVYRTAVLSITCGIACILLALVGCIAYKSLECTCQRNRGTKNPRNASNYYSDDAKEQECPPDTGIYMA